MSTDTIEITKYTKLDRQDLLRLLLELHSTYFIQNATPQIQELQEEKNIEKSYKEYVDFIEENTDDTWLALMAKTSTQDTIGFIIGSVETDDSRVLGQTGKFEDWYVESAFRGKGAGMKLYQELEQWFIEKGCKQVQSDTWEGNEASIKAHLHMGFFISGVQFSKKL